MNKLKELLKNLPIILWGIVFLFGIIGLTAVGNIPVLVIFVFIMVVLLVLAAILE